MAKWNVMREERRPRVYNKRKKYNQNNIHLYLRKEKIVVYILFNINIIQKKQTIS